VRDAATCFTFGKAFIIRPKVSPALTVMSLVTR